MSIIAAACLDFSTLLYFLDFGTVNVVQYGMTEGDDPKPMGVNMTNASYSMSNMLKHTISRSLRHQAYIPFHRQSISYFRSHFRTSSHSMSPARKIIIDTDPVVYPLLCHIPDSHCANNATIRESTTSSPCSSPFQRPQKSWKCS